MSAHNLPNLPTSFIGRSSELTEIATLLSDPACRLLTLLGPGGIGKVRLALQAATNLASHIAYLPRRAQSSHKKSERGGSVLYLNRACVPCYTDSCRLGW